MNTTDLVGKKFGKLTVIKFDRVEYKRDAKGKNRDRGYWLCRCDCGKKVTNARNDLVSGKTTFEKDDMLRIPFIKVDDEINYDELCGKEIKNSKYYIKQALQTIDFELNNVGGSVKSEAVIDATTKALTENARKMIFDSDFILYLKEENKEQPYFALKVDNTDVLVPNNLD